MGKRMPFVRGWGIQEKKTGELIHKLYSHELDALCIVDSAVMRKYWRVVRVEMRQVRG